MELTLILLVIVVLVIVVTLRSERKKKKAQQSQIAYTEAEGPIRAVNESFQIIATAQKMQTVRARVRVLEENLKKLLALEERGYQFTERSAKAMHLQLWDIVNLSIFQHASNEYKALGEAQSIHDASERGGANVEKARLRLTAWREALYTAGSNYEECKRRIQQLVDQLQEEPFAEQCKDIKEKAEKKREQSE